MAVDKGKDPNPYRLSFLQCVAVGETDEEAHREYGPHVEAAFQQGLGSLPMQSLGLPGYMDIKGIEFVAKDPGDFGIVPRMRTAKYAELVEAQCCIVGSPDTVFEQLDEMVKKFRIGNLVLMVQHGSMDTELTKKNITLLAEKVLPRLRDNWKDTEWENRWWPENAK